MSPIDIAGVGDMTTAARRRIVLSHTSDLGKHTAPQSFVAMRSRRCSEAVHSR